MAGMTQHDPLPAAGLERATRRRPDGRTLVQRQRRFGYFALPVLVGDDIVAAIDLKTDRQRQRLLMQKWTWVGHRRPRKDLKHRIEEELQRFERFQLAEG